MGHRAPVRLGQPGTISHCRGSVLGNFQFCSTTTRPGVASGHRRSDLPTGVGILRRSHVRHLGVLDAI